MRSQKAAWGILHMISAYICVGSGLNGTINGDFSAGWRRQDIESALG